MKLWDYDPQTLLPNLPTMVTFPKLGEFYQTWAEDLRSKGVDIRLSTDVTAILQRDEKKGVILQTRPFNAQARDRDGGIDSGYTEPLVEGEYTGPAAQTETFDELVMAILADDAKRLLGKTATWREKFVLGGAAFFDDITITHSDRKYFDSVYETNFNPELCAEPQSDTQKQQIAFAKGESRGLKGEPPGFRPMYYTHSYKEDPKKIEMSFDCTHYQHQFREGREVPDVPYDKHVFQSIFLDKQSRDLWTIDDIDPEKIIEKKWWHQLGHRWQHYVRVVPGMMFLNGRNRTLFAGSWTLVVSSIVASRNCKCS
jgi:hypothetical protein